MELMILGASSLQLAAYNKCKSKGIKTIACDYYEDAIGKTVADKSFLASTFDFEACYQVALANKVDGVLTLGTDQPVYTVTAIQEKLALQSFFSLETALKVTNKKKMKETFVENNIPCNKSKIINRNDNLTNLDLKFPLVIKPIDSQGQRGIYKVHSIEEIKEKIDLSLSFSKSDDLLLEEYYPSDEICMSGYVVNNKLYLLSITDRLTFEIEEHIGISYGHRFPSKYSNYYQEIEKLSQKIVSDFKILNGPVYFQMLIGDEGLKVNEIACRIGGAYEAYLIPELCGVDILEYTINHSLRLENDYQKLFEYNFYTNTKHAMVALFFCEPGKVTKIDCGALDNLTYKYGLNIDEGQILREIKDARNRAGYFITIADSAIQLKNSIDKIFSNIKILANDKNLIISNDDWEKGKSNEKS